jgi:hypothetical protein
MQREGGSIRKNHGVDDRGARHVASLRAVICALLLLPCLAYLAGVALAQGASEELVRVFYPRGDCETGIIELEIYDRSQPAWVPHPIHPRIEADTCQLEVAGILLQEIRYRCVDPEDPERFSDWVDGADVFRPRAAPECESE